MGKVNLNFGNLKATPPEGYYRFIAKKPLWLPSKSDSFNNVLNLYGAIIDSPIEEWENYQVNDFTGGTSSKYNLQRLASILEAFTQTPWDEDDMDFDFDDDSKIIDILKDQTCIALITNGKEYNGQPQMVIKYFYPDDGSIEIGTRG